MPLKTKITSEEQLRLLVRNYDYEQTYATLTNRVQGLTDGYISQKVSWWAVREQLRISKGIYIITDALEKVNQHCIGIFAHVSSEDPTMVAYTPDSRFGNEDRQLRITLGKLLARMLPMASDDYIRDLAAWHTAELSNEVDWVIGEDISKTYKDDTSTGACMSAKSFTTQPTISYAAEGIKMAVLRKSDGKLSARAMVYENGDDKRYIRGYGSPTLVKRLTRLGYKKSTWEGVKFNTVFIDADNNQISVEKAKKFAERHGYCKVVTPYLDANGGTCTNGGSSLALMDMQLICVPHEQHEILEALRYKLKVPSTAGYVELKNLDTEAYKCKDHFTGKELNRLTSTGIVREFASKLNGETVLSWFIYDEDLQVRENFERTKIYNEDGVYRHVFAKVEDTFKHRYERFFDDERSRKACGFKQLSKTYYPDENGWHGDTRSIKVGEDLHTILEDDCVVILNGETGAAVYSHKSAVKKGMIQLKTSGNLKGYAVNPKHVLRTASNAKVAFCYTEGLVRTYDGVDYKRNVKCVGEVLGTPIFALKSDNLYNISQVFVDHCETLYREDWKQRFNTFNGDYFAMLRSVTRHCYGYISPNSTNEYNRVTRHVQNIPDVDMRRSMPLMLEVLSDTLRANFLDKWKERLVRDVMYKLVEATAIEQPVRAASSVVTTVTAVEDERFALAA